MIPLFSHKFPFFLHSPLHFPFHILLQSLLLPFNPSYMLPVKSEGSSRRKGKEAIVDKPLVEAEKGEEAPYSKLDRSEEEEVSRDPDSECPPLIDPRYDIHSHFLVVSGDYSHPLLGCVWLSLEGLDFNISWAPLAFSILDLAIRRGDTLPVPILFEFGLGAPLGWKEWMDRYLSDTGFMKELQRVSVLKAIVSS